MVAMSGVLGRSSRREHAWDGASPSASDVLVVDIGRIITLLWLATAIVLGLAILREFVISIIGTGTALKDLRHFSLDSEHSLPAWYESATMLASAGLLTILAALARHDDPRNRLPWMLLAIIFLLMSIDELVAFHEGSMRPLREAFHLTGIFYFLWVIIAAPLLVALAIYFVPFMLRLPRPTAVRFFIAGAIFVSGAFGMEFIGGYYVSFAGYDYLPYRIASTCEESLEIIGMTLFLSSLLRHLAEVAPVLQVTMKQWVSPLVPAKAGIKGPQTQQPIIPLPDSRFRGNERGLF